MKYILITILMLSFPTDPLKIGKINSTKAQARKAYTSGDYKTAIAKYRYLIDSLQVNEDEVMLNLANAYYQSKDTANAFSTYQSLTGSTKNVVRSKAQQQIGVMNHQKGKLEEALNNFKQAIKADPNNMDARYNYEMLKKKIEEKKKQDQQKKDQNKDKQDQNKDQKDQKKDQEKKDQEKKDEEKKDQEKKDQEKKDQEKKDQEKKDQENKDQKDKNDQEQKDQKKKEEEKKDQQNKDQQDQENKDEQNADKKEQQQNVSKKLEQMKISKEKANALLEAMKNQEVQYLQENKRKATKPKDRTKPDW